MASDEDDDPRIAAPDDVRILDSNSPAVSAGGGYAAEENFNREIDEVTADSYHDNESDEHKLFTTRGLVTVLVLFFVNLLNYMDRFTIAGVVTDVQKFYNVDNGQAGLLQTVFICSYMILSPIFGYLGDRYNRKILMAVGIFFWSAVTLAGSFVGREHFWLFMLLRGMVGIGEASYSTIAPTVIADLYVKSMRSKMLAIFYFAIPVGSGLGYIVGSKVSVACGMWYWALRVTPGLGVIAVILILVLVQEPERGASEGGSHLSNTSYIDDLKSLCFNKSFVCSSLGFTCVAFVTGALAWWAPKFMLYSVNVQGINMDIAGVSWIFGIITCIAGFIGVGSGAFIATWYKRRNPRADPLVCAFGMLMCSPFLFFALTVSGYNTMVTWILIFIGETLLCMNWSIVADMLLYTVVPTRRSTAEAFQILMSHLLGDAGSPYLVGTISDFVAAGDNSTVTQFISLQNSLYMTTFVTVIGGGAFLLTAIFIENDRKRAETVVKDAAEQHIFRTSPSDDTTYVSNPPPKNDIRPVGGNVRA